MTRTIFAGLALAAALSSPALAQYAPGYPVPYAPIPEPRYEAVPPPPGPPQAWLWERGHYRWDGRGYAWFPGRYIAREAGYHEFVPGHWAQRPYGPPIWVPEHWR